VFFHQNAPLFLCVFHAKRIKKAGAALVTAPAFRLGINDIIEIVLGGYFMDLGGKFMVLGYFTSTFSAVPSDILTMLMPFCGALRRMPLRV